MIVLAKAVKHSTLAGIAAKHFNRVSITLTTLRSNMKLTINSAELSKSIDRVIKFIPAKPLMPIIGNIKLVASDKLDLLAFDLSNGIQSSVAAEVIELGEICVPAQMFSAIIKGMTGQLIIEVDGDTMTISNLTGSCEIQCQQADEYPDFVNEEIDKTIQCEIDIKTFAQGIKLGGACVSDDATKPILQGANITAQDGLLTIASTNGHKLIVFKTAIDPAISIPSSTIPTKSLSAIEGDGTMTLTIDKTTCMVATENTIVTCRPYADTYPNYPMLLPKSFSRFCTINRTQLVDALNLMSSIGNENSVVKFNIGKKKLIASSEKEGAKGNRTIDCELDGKELEIAFSIKYLLAQLKVIPSQKIEISMNGELEPVVIKPVDASLDLLCLVMPITLRD
jgi:DNA polymerase III subunit beta